MTINARNWNTDDILKFDWVVSEGCAERIKLNRPELKLDGTKLVGLSGRGKAVNELSLDEHGALLVKVCNCISEILADQNASEQEPAAFKLEHLLQLDDIRTEYGRLEQGAKRNRLSHDAAARLSKLAEGGHAQAWLLPLLCTTDRDVVDLGLDAEIPWHQREVVQEYLVQLLGQDAAIDDTRQRANLLIAARMLGLEVAVDPAGLEEAGLFKSYSHLLSIGSAEERQALQQWHNKQKVVADIAAANLPVEQAQFKTLTQAQHIVQWAQSSQTTLAALHAMFLEEVHNHPHSYKKPTKQNSKLSFEDARLGAFVDFQFNYGKHKSLSSLNCQAFQGNWGDQAQGITAAAKALIGCFQAACNKFLAAGAFNIEDVVLQQPSSTHSLCEVEQKLCQLNNSFSRIEAAEWACDQAKDILADLLGVQQGRLDGKAFLTAYAQGALPESLQHCICNGGKRALMNRLAFLLLAAKTPPNLCGVPIQLQDIFALAQLMGVADQESFLHLVLGAALRTPGLRGSPLSFQQGKNLIQVYDSFRHHKTDVITDAAGSGKTTTISFLAQLVQMVKEAHLSADALPSIVWLSPYPVSLQGVSALVLDQFAGDIHLPVSDGQDIFLVIDEAHLLGPRSKQDLQAGGVHFYAGDQEISNYIGLTATPNLAGDYTEVLEQLRTQRANVLQRYQGDYQRHLDGHQAQLNELYCSLLPRLYDDWRMAIQPACDSIRKIFDVQNGTSFEQKTLKAFEAALEKGVRESKEALTHYNLLRGRIERIRTAQRTERREREQLEIIQSTNIANDLQSISNALEFFQAYKRDKPLNIEGMPQLLLDLIQPQLDEITACEDAVLECRRCLAEIQGMLDEGRADVAQRPVATHPLEGAIDWHAINPAAPILGMLQQYAPAWQQGKTQIVLPHSRLTFDDAYRLSEAIIKKCKGATVVWHSQVASDIDNPKDWIVAKAIEAGITTDFCTKKELDALNGPVIMLYDSTTMQGGDFGSLSADSNTARIQQLILDGFRVTKQASDAPLSSADWQQCLARRRNLTAESLNAVVLSGETRETRQRQAVEQQHLREIHFSIMSLESKLAALDQAANSRDYMQDLMVHERELLRTALQNLREQQDQLLDC